MNTINLTLQVKQWRFRERCSQTFAQRGHTASPSYLVMVKGSLLFFFNLQFQVEAFAAGIKPHKEVKERIIELKGFPAAALNREFWKLLRL